MRERSHAQRSLQWNDGVVVDGSGDGPTSMDYGLTTSLSSTLVLETPGLVTSLLSPVQLAGPMSSALQLTTEHRGQLFSPPLEVRQQLVNAAGRITREICVAYVGRRRGW